MSAIHNDLRYFKHTSNSLTLSSSYHIFAKQCRYSFTVNFVCVLYTRQLVQTTRKLITKCGLLHFTKKVISRKNYDFLEIPNFSKFTISIKTPEISDPSTKIPGNLGPRKPPKCKNIRVSRNSRVKSQIFPGKFLRKFGIFTTFRGDPSRNSREFWSKKPRKMQKYTGFTGFWG